VLTEETSVLRSAISKTEAETRLLREYRTRLTAGVVTGQLDVREAAEKLPDAPMEQEANDDEGVDVDDEDEGMES